MKLKADPRRSDREIAAEVGVSDPTVGKVRRAMEAAGVVQTFSTTVGKDGVTQPRAKKNTSADKRSGRWGAMREEGGGRAAAPTG